MTVKNGVRWSAANAYLRPARTPPNLNVVDRALATRIVFEGRRAIGVRYMSGGLEHLARARREVILSGGPINSPQLLKLSGVGPAEELQRLRNTRRPRSAGRRREPARPPRILFSDRFEAADHALCARPA